MRSKMSSIGAGALSKIFENSQEVGTNASNFNREIAAVQLAAKICQLPSPNSLQTCCLFHWLPSCYNWNSRQFYRLLHLFHCHEAITHLLQNNWTVTLPWIPSHRGIAGRKPLATRTPASPHTKISLMQLSNPTLTRCTGKQAEKSSGLHFATEAPCRQSPTGKLQ